ncbi:hypothetical protein V6N13_073282 [Hibiscus sabdariffa]|uniref:Uncharacterized protein n=1 Tax=Hibiscus sabdariffa TaxID=183260 RepID=A0ABR2E938_9ROSI
MRASTTWIRDEKLLLKTKIPIAKSHPCQLKDKQAGDPSSNSDDLSFGKKLLNQAGDVNIAPGPLHSEAGIISDQRLG